MSDSLQQLHTKYGDLQGRLLALQSRPTNRANSQPQAEQQAPGKAPAQLKPPPIIEESEKENAGRRADVQESEQSASASDVQHSEQLFTFGPMVGSTKIGQTAVEVFKEPNFMHSIDQGLNAQLQRTKEGATAQSRIIELAGEWQLQGLGAQCHVFSLVWDKIRLRSLKHR